MADARGFSAQIDAEFEASLSEWNIIIRKVALEAYSRVILKTPVDTGRARGNWFVQIGRAGDEIDVDMKSKTGIRPISKAETVVKKYDIRKDKREAGIFLYNNLPYIRRLEYGWSQRQAPNGMVRVTVAEIVSGLGI